MVSRFVSGPLRVVPAALTMGLAVTLGLTGCSAGQVTQTDSIPPAVNGNLGQVGSILLRDVVIEYPAEGQYDKDGTAPLVLSIVNIGTDDDELTDVSSPAAKTVELVGDPKVPSGMALIVVGPEDDEAPEGAEEAATSTEASATSGAEPTGATTTTEPGGETTGDGAATSGAATTTATGGAATGGVTSTTTTGESSAESEKETTEVVGRISILLSELRSALAVGKTVPVTFSFAKAGQITLDLPIAAPEEPREDVTGAEAEGGH